MTYTPKKNGNIKKAQALLKERRAIADRDLRAKAKRFNKKPTDINAEELVEAERKINRQFNPAHQGKSRNTSKTFEGWLWLALRVLFISYIFFIALRPWFCGLTGNC